MRHLALLRCPAVLAALFLALAPVAAMACATPPGAAALERGMIDWINDQRRANGRPALKPSAKLASAAKGHACDMAGRGYFSHQRAGGPDLSARVKGEGYRFRKIAENIAKSRNSSVEAAATIWRKSPDHWRNILRDDVADIGLGVSTAGGSLFWVMNVGRSR